MRFRLGWDFCKFLYIHQSPRFGGEPVNLNDPQQRLRADFFPNYEHKQTSSFQDVLGVLASKARSSVEKGRAFEALVKAFIEVDTEQSRRFKRVWLWAEYPNRGNRQDTGIDLVARERDSGGLVAIQAKFYAPDAPIPLDQLNKFLAAYSTDEFAAGVFVSTTANWTENAKNALLNRKSKPVVRWLPEVFENSSIDWEDFSLARPRALRRKAEIRFPQVRKARRMKIPTIRKRSNPPRPERGWRKP